MGIGISAINGGYGNYGAYNDDFLAQQLYKNNNSANNTSTNTQSDSVSFSGNEKDTAKETSSKLTTLLIAGGVAITAFVVGKNWNAIKGYVTKLLNGKTTQKAKTALEKAKTKAWDMVNTGKAKIKGTSVTGASKPITNAQEAKVIQNIETKNASSQARKLVETHMNDIVTPEMQAAYDKSIAYKPLTANQKQAKAVREMQNAAQRAELNSIANNSKGAETLQAVAQTAAKNEAAAQVIKNGGHLNPTNNNIYFTKDGVITQIRTAIPNSKGEYVISDPKKIAKHLAKYNINISDFANSNTHLHAT